MPDLCRGSGGTPNENLGEGVVLTATSIGAFLGKRMTRETANFLGGLLAGTAYVAEVVCANDPPADPGLGEADFTALLEYQNPIPFSVALARLKDWFLAQYWPIICLCNDGQPPAVPVVVIPPNTITRDVGLPPGQIGANCWDSAATIPTNSPQGYSFTPYLPQIGAMPGWPANSGPAPQRLQTPLPTSIQFRFTRNTDSSDGAQHYSGQIQFWDINAALISGGFFLGDTPPGVVSTLAGAIPANAAYANVMCNALSGANRTGTATGEVTLFCGGNTSTTPSTPCCPPDPIVQSLLNQIYSMVTLLQRQVAPFAYVQGKSHLGVTGNGEIAVQGLLGVKVLPRSIPPGTGMDIGDPDTLWLESWINWGNPDGWAPRDWLRASPHISLPALPGQWTKIGYTIQPNMLVDIIELVREP